MDIQALREILISRKGFLEAWVKGNINGTTSAWDIAKTKGMIHELEFVLLELERIK